jgi:hypothetical protein
VGRRLLAGQDVPVGIPAQHADTRQALQQLEHFRGAGAEQDQVTQRPPPVHVIAGRIIEHRAQRHVVSVDIGDDGQLHARQLMSGCRGPQKLHRRAAPRLFAQPRLRWSPNHRPVLFA